jgi:hypothetical protein
MEYLHKILNENIKDNIDVTTYNNNNPNLVIEIGKYDNTNGIFNKNLDNDTYFTMQKRINNIIKKYIKIRSSNYFYNNLEYIISNDKHLCISHNNKHFYNINIGNSDIRLKILNSKRVDNLIFPALDSYHNIENRDIRTYKYFIRRNKLQKTEYININFIRSNNKFFHINISVTCTDTNFDDVIRTIVHIIKILYGMNNSK